MRTAIYVHKPNTVTSRPPTRTIKKLLYAYKPTIAKRPAVGTHALEPGI